MYSNISTKFFVTDVNLIDHFVNLNSLNETNAEHPLGHYLKDCSFSC
jgi:hypothetical protein